MRNWATILVQEFLQIKEFDLIGLIKFYHLAQLKKGSLLQTTSHVSNEAKQVWQSIEIKNTIHFVEEIVSVVKAFM